MTFDFSMETTNYFKEIKFEWKIRNFSKLLDEVEGPPFTPLAGHSSRWQVVLKFGKNTSGSFYMTVFLKSLDEEGAAPTLRVAGKISLKNSEGTVWKQNLFNTIIKSSELVQCWNIGNLGYQLPSSIINVFGLCADDVFVMEWSMTVSGIITSIVTPPVPDIPAVKEEDEDICNAFKLIYKKNAFTDVKFHIGKQTITAHKAVLSARSAVFEKMFEHDTLEKETSSIDIKDFNYRIFDCFIEYVYTKEIRNEVEKDVNSLLALYEVADKYEVIDLHKCCADILLSSFLNVNTVVAIVEIADMHSDKYLKEPAVQFIRHRFSEVAATSDWTHLMKRNLELASNIVSYVTTFVDEGKEPKEN